MNRAAAGKARTAAGPPNRFEGAIARVTLWLIVFFSFVSLVAIFLLQPHGSAAANAARIAMPLVVLSACVAAFFLARRGRPRVGAGIVVAVAYAAIVNYVVVGGFGLHSYMVSILAILVVIASLLVGHRAGLWACAVALATVIALFALERLGRIMDEDAVRGIPLDNIAMVYSILIGATGAVLYVFSKAFHETLEAASDEEQRLRTLIDLAPMGYVLHRDGRIVIANRAAALSGGHDRPEDLVGKDAFGFVPEEQREAAKRRMGEAKAGAPGSSVQFEYRAMDKRGRERTFETLTAPVALADGPALLTVMRDVTRARESSAALASAKAQAESANLAKSHFLANMSHEIRTPLNGVLGMADLLRGTPLSAEQRRYCEAIASSGRGLRDLLGDILDLSKIEAGKVELEREDFNLSRVLADLVSAHSELARARGNALHAALELPEEARYNGDALRLRQVLGNLLSNAVKFTENGRIELRAQALEARPGNARPWLRFTVKDTGIGISAETQARLFQPFSQADSSTTRQYGGTGLGLTISKHLVELMGGRIGVRSTPGAGSEFSVELPLEPAQTRAQAQAQAVQAGASLAVLVVEDNDINQEVARAMLEVAGHRVEVAANGAEALKKCAQSHFDCVLMDCQMPGMDGYEATRRIRAREAENGGVRVPIVALTANAMSGDRERCLAAGMDDFLAKPFDSAALLAALARGARLAQPQPALSGKVANA